MRPHSYHCQQVGERGRCFGRCFFLILNKTSFSLLHSCFNGELYFSLLFQIIHISPFISLPRHQVTLCRAAAFPLLPRPLTRAPSLGVSAMPPPALVTDTRTHTHIHTWSHTHTHASSLSSGCGRAPPREQSVCVERERYRTHSRTLGLPPPQPPLARQRRRTEAPPYCRREREREK